MQELAALMDCAAAAPLDSILQVSKCITRQSVRAASFVV